MSIINLIKDYRKEFLEIGVRKGFIVFDYEQSFKLMKAENIILTQTIEKSIDTLKKRHLSTFSEKEK